MALTIAPDFNDGPITAAKLQQLSDAINERTPLRARLTADHPLTASDTTLENVTGLVVALPANTIWEGYLDAAWTLAAGAAEDIAFGFDFPTGAVCDAGGVGPHTAMAAGTAFGDGEFVRRLSMTAASTKITFGASTGVAGGTIQIAITVGNTAGNLQVMACQGTSGVNVVTVKAGSRLVLTRIS